MNDNKQRECAPHQMTMTKEEAEMNDEKKKKIIQNKTCVQNKRNTKRANQKKNFFFFICFSNKKPTIYVERLHKREQRRVNSDIFEKMLILLVFSR